MTRLTTVLSSTKRTRIKITTPETNPKISGSIQPLRETTTLTRRSLTATTKLQRLRGATMSQAILAIIIRLIVKGQDRPQTTGVARTRSTQTKDLSGEATSTLATNDSSQVALAGQMSSHSATRKEGRPSMTSVEMSLLLSCQSSRASSR